MHDHTAKISDFGLTRFRSSAPISEAMWSPPPKPVAALLDSHTTNATLRASAGDDVAVHAAPAAAAAALSVSEPEPPSSYAVFASEPSGDRSMSDSYAVFPSEADPLDIHPSLLTGASPDLSVCVC
jgi:hypothetical protein